MDNAEGNEILGEDQAGSNHHYDGGPRSHVTLLIELGGSSGARCRANSRWQH